jgi:hypothetical protein
MGARFISEFLTSSRTEPRPYLQVAGSVSLFMSPALRANREGPVAGSSDRAIDRASGAWPSYYSHRLACIRSRIISRILSPDRPGRRFVVEKFSSNALTTMSQWAHAFISTGRERAYTHGFLERDSPGLALAPHKMREIRHYLNAYDSGRWRRTGKNTDLGCATGATKSRVIGLSGKSVFMRAKRKLFVFNPSSVAKQRVPTLPAR